MSARAVEASRVRTWNREFKKHILQFQSLPQIDAKKFYSFFISRNIFYMLTFIRTNLIRIRNLARKISFHPEFNIANISLPVQRRSFLLHRTDTKLHLQHVQISSTKLSTTPSIAIKTQKKLNLFCSETLISYLFYSIVEGNIQVVLHNTPTLFNFLVIKFWFS